MAAPRSNHTSLKRKREALSCETQRAIRAIDEHCAAIEAQELEELKAALRASVAVEAILVEDDVETVLVEDSLDAEGTGRWVTHCAVAEKAPVVVECAKQAVLDEALPEENVSEALRRFGCLGEAVAKMPADVAQCLLSKLRQWDADGEVEMFTFRQLVEDCRMTAGLGLVVCQDGVNRGHGCDNGKVHVFVYDAAQLRAWVQKSRTDPSTNSALSLGQIIIVS